MQPQHRSRLVDVLDLDGDGDLDIIGPQFASFGHFAIYSNLTRHAAATTLAKPAQPLGLAVFGQPTEPWLLAASMPNNSSVQLPFGTLFLEPISTVVLFAGLVPSGGRSTVSLMIPAGTAGKSLTWQALVGTSPALSNAFDTAILP